MDKALTQNALSHAGKTGVKISAIGLDGFHLGLSHLEEPDAIKIFHSAIDRDINFSDNSSDIEGILKKTVTVAADGKFEPFKTTPIFDSTAAHPEWLGYAAQA